MTVISRLYTDADVSRVMAWPDVRFRCVGLNTYTAQIGEACIRVYRTTIAWSSPDGAVTCTKNVWRIDLDDRTLPCGFTARAAARRYARGAVAFPVSGIRRPIA